MTTAVACEGVVIVHCDGTFTCLRPDCPAGDHDAPTDLVEHHGVFVSCREALVPECPRCVVRCAS